MIGPGSNTESQGWQPGDLALCVRPGKWFDPVVPNDGSGPGMGAIHEVEEVGEYEGMMLLGFPAWPEEFFDASAFRKIEPLSDLETEKFKVSTNVTRIVAGRRAQALAK